MELGFGSYGLGFLAGSCCPHYDGETERRSAYHQAIRDGLPGGYAADDGAALHFVGTELIEAVSSVPNARVYQVARQGSDVTETALPTRFLG